MAILRDYQQEAVLFLFPLNRGCVVAPAGSGKTIIAAEAAANACCRQWALHQRTIKLVWLCNTKEQKEQGERALMATGCSAPVDISVECFAAQADLSDCDVCIVDECHHVPAKTLLDTLAKLPTGSILYGFTATPTHEDPFRNAAVQLCFAQFFTIGRERVIASGHLETGKVLMYDLDAPGMYDAQIDARTAIELAKRMKRMPWLPRFEQERRIKWQVTQEIIQENACRNACAAWLANSESAKGESVLMLIFSIEHGKKLLEQMPGADYVNSKLTKKKRQKLVEDFRSGMLKTLVATSLADEGLDVPRASRLVLVAGGRSAGKLEQRAGRVLRPFEGKNGGVIYDFLDRGATFAHAQAKARMKVYENLGYNPEIVSLQKSFASVQS